MEHTRSLTMLFARSKYAGTIIHPWRMFQDQKGDNPLFPLFGVWILWWFLGWVAEKIGWWFSLWCHYSMYGSYESNMSLVYDSIVRIPVLGGWINNFVNHIGLVQSWSLSKFDVLIPSAKVVAQHGIFNNRLGPCLQHLRPFAILKSRGLGHESEITH